MTTIADIRKQYPQYADMSDRQLADAMHRKFYADMPKAEFDKKIGMQAPPPGDIGDVLSAGFTSGVNAIPFLGPSIMGGLNQVKAAVHGVPVEEIAAENTQLEEQNPVASMVGSVAGPTVALAPLGMTSLGARALGLTGTTGQRMIAGGLSGLGIAGGDSAVRGNAPDEVAIDALVGGTIGTLLPGAAATGKALLRGMTGKAVPKPVKNVARALRDDNVPVDDISARLQSMGPESQLMDLGPNLQRQAGALAAVPGQGQKTIRDAIDFRKAGASPRVQADVQATFGNGPELSAMKEQIIAQQKAAAGPLYDAVRDVKIDMLRGNFAYVFKTPMGQQALKTARQMAANDGYRGTDTIQIIDYAKQALDDIQREAIRQGRNNIARQAGDLAKVLRSEADKLVPQYKQAREAFAGPAQVIDAMDSGATVFSKDMTPAQLKSAMGAMTASERDAFLQGARASLEAQMGTAVNDALSLRNMFKKSWNEEKLRIVLGDKVANDLLSRISREATFGQTAHVVAGNSETAARQAAMGEVAPELSRAYRPEGIIGAVLSAFDAARNSVRGVRQPKTNSKMAEMLTSGSLDPRTMDQLRRASIPRPPAFLPPAGFGVAATQDRQPIEITVRGGR
jgi:hypothetical protein